MGQQGGPLLFYGAYYSMGGIDLFLKEMLDEVVKLLSLPLLLPPLFLLRVRAREGNGWNLLSNQRRSCLLLVSCLLFVNDQFDRPSNPPLLN